MVSLEIRKTLFFQVTMTFPDARVYVILSPLLTPVECKSINWIAVAWQHLLWSCNYWEFKAIWLLRVFRLKFRKLFSSGTLKFVVVYEKTFKMQKVLLIIFKPALPGLKALVQFCQVVAWPTSGNRSFQKDSKFSAKNSAKTRQPPWFCHPKIGA